MPKTEAVDTFTVNWSGETCWLVPPLYLVGHALLHAEACKARGALVVPLWKSAAFWPPLCPDGRHWAPVFHAWQSFPVFDGIFLPGRCGKLCESDIVVCKEHIEIFIESSKTDQLRDGAWVVIARSDSPPCPVAMLLYAHG